MAIKRVGDYLRTIYVITILTSLCLLLGLGFAPNFSEHAEQDMRMLIFTIGEQQVKIGPEDIEDIDVGVIHKMAMATVEFTLAPQAAQAIHNLTAANIGQSMQVRWNGTIITEDVIESPLDNEISLTNLSPQFAQDFEQWVNQNKKDNEN